MEILRNYKYQLDHKNVKKGVCPSCGRNEFTYYTYLEENKTGNKFCKVLDVECGKCDRELKCGYHYTPRDLFRDHPEKRPSGEGGNCAADEVATPQRKVVFMNDQFSRWVSESVEKHLQNHSNFLRWLLSLWDEKPVLEVILKYYVGISPDGFEKGLYSGNSPLFWYIDSVGGIVDCKGIEYDNNGHRKHGTYSTQFYRNRFEKQNQQKYWENTEKAYLMKWRAPQRAWLPDNSKPELCFFGEHLLEQHQDYTVCVVESEKSALIGAIQFRDEVARSREKKYLWIATGGKGNLSARHCKALTGRNVLVFPDSDGQQAWKEKEAELRRSSGAASLMVVNLEKFCKAQGVDIKARGKGYDVADLFVELAERNRNNTSADEVENAELVSPELAHMMNGNPFVRELVNELSLTETP